MRGAVVKGAVVEGGVVEGVWWRLKVMYKRYLYITLTWLKVMKGISPSICVYSDRWRLVCELSAL